MTSKKEKHTRFDSFSIKIEVKAIGLGVLVCAKDPLDCISISGAVIAELRRLDKEPTVVILP